MQVCQEYVFIVATYKGPCTVLMLSLLGLFQVLGALNDAHDNASTSSSSALAAG